MVWNFGLMRGLRSARGASSSSSRSGAASSSSSSFSQTNKGEASTTPTTTKPVGGTEGGRSSFSAEVVLDVSKYSNKMSGDDLLKTLYDELERGMDGAAERDFELNHSTASSSSAATFAEVDPPNQHHHHHHHHGRGAAAAFEEEEQVRTVDRLKNASLDEMRYDMRSYPRSFSSSSSLSSTTEKKSSLWTGKGLVRKGKALSPKQAMPKKSPRRSFGDSPRSSGRKTTGMMIRPPPAAGPPPYSPRRKSASEKSLHSSFRGSLSAATLSSASLGEWTRSSNKASGDDLLKAMYAESILHKKLGSERSLDWTRSSNKASGDDLLKTMYAESSSFQINDGSSDRSNENKSGDTSSSMDWTRYSNKASGDDLIRGLYEEALVMKKFAVPSRGNSFQDDDGGAGPFLLVENLDSDPLTPTLNLFQQLAALSHVPRDNNFLTSPASCAPPSPPTSPGFRKRLLADANLLLA